MTVAVALSGGIDSLVAAWLLKKSGTPLIGIHFITGYESANRGYAASGSEKNEYGNTSRANPAEQAAHQLGIPLQIMDCRRVFEEQIVKYFAETYQSGRTPNPCVLCNRIIKFGKALEFAQSLGADCLATGHYANLEKTGKYPALKKGSDIQKDQSYFLGMLSSDQLSRAVFPLGGMHKEGVKKLAHENGLKPASDKESQDICFIRNKTYAGFLEARGEIRIEPGAIVDVQGNTIGRHNGLHRYTIGQRRGINCPAPAPYYVVRIEPEFNQLVVGFKNTVYKDHCYINRVNWLIPRPDKPVRVKAKIRYRHHEADALLEHKAGDRALIRFSQPQAAVTPGQAAVCYIDDTVAAGGWIEKESRQAS
ncbi:MAG: tRNA 2-thiouridine(34) synthase MnmA [Thermodesulfobacteriota bacterium]